MSIGCWLSNTSETVSPRRNTAAAVSLANGKVMRSASPWRRASAMTDPGTAGAGAGFVSFASATGAGALDGSTAGVAAVSFRTGAGVSAFAAGAAWAGAGCDGLACSGFACPRLAWLGVVLWRVGWVRVFGWWGVGGGWCCWVGGGGRGRGGGRGFLGRCGFGTFRRDAR